MILYKKYLCFISSDDVFGNKNLTRRVGSSARLGSAGAFRPDPELQHIFNSSDMVLFTESWTDENSELFVNNFEYFVLNRKLIKQGSRRNSGGIVLYLRNNFVSNDTLVFTSEDYFLWIKLVNLFCFQKKTSMYVYAM